MSKKLKRSAIALVLAATMVLSSQGLTAFADKGNDSGMPESLSVQTMGEKAEDELTIGQSSDDAGQNGNMTPSAPMADNALTVAEQINALPSADDLANYSPTIELKPEDEGYQETYQAALDTYYSQVKKDVEVARAAYDALTEEQKVAFDATILAKLTALEELIALREQADVLPETEEIDPDTFAIIKTDESLQQYKTLDEAVEAAEEGSTITLLKDCELTKGFNKTLTFTGGHKITINKQLTSNGEGWMCFGLYDSSRVLTFDNVEVEWNSEVGTSPWLMLSLSGTMNVTNGAHVKFTVDSGSTGSRNAIYMNAGSSINVSNGSTFAIYGYGTAGKEGQGIQLDQTRKATINVTGNSTFLIDGTNRGYVNSPTIYVEGSTFTVQNCTANASNGGKFTAINSKVTYYNNAGHGLSAENVTIQNSTLNAEKNGYRGISINSGKLSVDSTSTLNVTENSHAGDYAGLKLTSGSDGLVKSGATVNITDNYCSGLSNNGVCEFEEGVKLTITGNQNSQGGETGSHGGGIYNSGNAANLTLPSDAVIYNNHALTDGDDIYNSGTITFGKVSEGWTLEGTRLVSENKTEEECGHTITGWFDDSANNRWNVHTGPVHAELYDFEDATTTVSGTLALKAAHPYQYDPEAPTEPSDPVKWGTSKSKTATNLDANYESQVTLSLPAAETVPVTDVVFVLDRSSSAGAARQEISDMMDNLLQIVNNSDAVINVGVVNFWYKADSGIALTALTNESIDSIKNAIMEGNLSGTNIEAGIDAAVAMLDASSTPDENKYMVLVTDGISHAWNDSNGQPMATWGEGNADGTVIHGGTSPYIYFDTDKTNFDEVYRTSPSDEKLSDIYDVPVFDDKGNELTSSDIGDKYIRMDEYSKYYTSVEKGIYKAAHSYAEAASKYKCINLYWNVSDDYLLATQFMAWTGTQGKCYNISDDLSGAFEEVEREITYVVDAGSQVIDVIGGDDDGIKYDYDFDFVDVISLTVGGEELDFTKEGNTYYFGDSIDGTYPFVLTYYPNGLGVATMSIEDEQVIAGELFVWEINVPITIDKSVQLTYTVKLSNPKTVDGTYGQYDADGSKNYDGLYTNNSAVLFPVDSNGNVGEKEAFDKPTVSYTVSNGKPVNPPENPDPTPDPDHPSRPSRDDDDWEPLPNVPVKDKPQKAETETKVPVETETPAPEQPDKYNPETGDTTTVFAAMALAAVSLGGVVLLGRKKK